MTHDEIATHIPNSRVENDGVTFECPVDGLTSARAVCANGLVHFGCSGGCAEAEIINAVPRLGEWLAENHGNGRPSAESPLVNWKLALSEYVKQLARYEQAYEWTRADFRTYLLDDVRGLPERRPEDIFLHPPAALSATEIEEEIQAVIDVYAPAVSADKGYESNGGNEVARLPDKQGIMLVDEYLQQYTARASRPYVWEEMLYRGSFNTFLGRPLAGKSSFAAALLRAVAAGESFLGRRCNKQVCAYLALERNGAQVAKLLADWGLAKTVYFADEIPGRNAAAYITDQIKELNLMFVVIDHLQHATHLQHGNDYAEVSNALKPYQDMSKATNSCILGLHHQGKPKAKEDREGMDEGVIEVLGSEAYRAASDTMMEATVWNGEYFLRAQPREGTDLPRMQIMIDFETGEVDGLDAGIAEIEMGVTRVCEYLYRVNLPATEKEIRDQVQGPTKTISIALRRALQDGRIIRSGKGGRADPYRYVLVQA